MDIENLATNEREVVFEHLIEFIHSAIESEQPDGPALFSDETERRMALVSRKLREVLNLPE